MTNTFFSQDIITQAIEVRKEAEKNYKHLVRQSLANAFEIMKEKGIGMSSREISKMTGVPVAVIAATLRGHNVRFYFDGKFYDIQKCTAYRRKEYYAVENGQIDYNSCMSVCTEYIEYRVS